MRPTCEDSVGMSSVPPTALPYAYPLQQNNDVDDLLFFLAPTSTAPMANLQPNLFDVAALVDLQGLKYSLISSSAYPPCLI